MTSGVYRLNIERYSKDIEEKKENLQAVVNAIEKDVKVLDFLVGLETFRNKIVLDLGCGACIPSAGIAHLSPHVIGVDLSRPVLKEVGDAVLDHFNAYVHRVCADFTRLPFRDGSMDIVLGGGYLHHVSDLSVLLKEIWRVLKIGGLLISTDEPIKTITWTSDTYSSEIDFPHFTWEWRKVFLNNGFELQYCGVRPLGKVRNLLNKYPFLVLPFEFLNNLHLGIVYSFVAKKLSDG